MAIADLTTDRVSAHRMLADRMSTDLSTDFTTDRTEDILTPASAVRSVEAPASQPEIRGDLEGDRERDADSRSRRRLPQQNSDGDTNPAEGDSSVHELDRLA